MMSRLLLTSLWRLGRLILASAQPGPGHRLPGLRRSLALAAFLPLFVLVQAIHWLGFLCDEIFFPGYKRVPLREPLIVLGVPRSGTTNLHRVLARDPQFTTFSTWECLFALSVTARRFWMGLARLDRALGGQAARLLEWLQGRAFGAMEAVHSMRLSDPEEDYFALMPILACFILVLPFPNAPWLWRMGRFDCAVPEAERQRLLAFYRGCLQRHLYVHGTNKRLLSKNAAFAPLAGSLRDQFPDARFIVCLREPETTLPSQLSSIQAGIRWFDADRVVPDINERLTQQLGYYYRNLEQALRDIPGDRCAWVTMTQLKTDLEHTLADTYERLGLAMPERFAVALQQQAQASRDYRSTHSYRLEDFGLSRTAIAEELGSLYDTLVARTGEATAEVTAAGDPSRAAAQPPRPPSTTEPALPC